ncbi:hypothetical protein [Micromonospora narathiwatensis]|uniref:Uncharacterized protein n=1 Tax=Micromonospora narathiwatensis TaxID=299146 RepID=A0A1A8ZD01_9ACTN|nr:hypothetical protein [Micromonospora narathiwatensis]SBT41728.1 hypothetical protein GA0070621_1312 [Micromonospora narathiwatensis]
MTEPEETREDTERSEPIIAPPTANPSRVKVPPEGLKQHTDKGGGEPMPSGPPPGEEA